MKCALHPGTETNLSCGKCGQPICPKCLVQTPVGARCPKCAAMKRLPVFNVSALSYIRAIGASLATGGVLGAVWPFVPLGGYFWLLIALGVGYAVGQAVSLSVNRKRGPGLQAIAAVGVVVSYVVRGILERMLQQPQVSVTASFVTAWGLLSLALGIVVTVSVLRRD